MKKNKIIKKLSYYLELKCLDFLICNYIKLVKIIRSNYIDVLSSIFFRLSLLDKKFKIKAKEYYDFLQEVSNG